MTRRPDDTDLAILQLVALGHTNVAIASRLHLSRDTIAHRLSQLMARMGAFNRAHLVTIAISTGALAVADLTEAGSTTVSTR